MKRVQEHAHVINTCKLVSLPRLKNNFLSSPKFSAQINHVVREQRACFKEQISFVRNYLLLRWLTKGRVINGMHAGEIRFKRTVVINK
jgi:hypothetical protein